MVFSSSYTSMNPSRKRCKGKQYITLAEKYLIIKTYHRELLLSPLLNIVDVMKNVGTKVGVSHQSIYRVLREYKQNSELSAPITHKNRTAYVLDSIDKVKKDSIRRKVHEFYFRNELPTIDKILHAVNEDSGLPNFKRTSFYKLLKQINFLYKKCGKHSMLVDREEIILWRRKYLKKIKSFRNANKKIYYLGETWKNTIAQSSKHPSTGLKIPSAKRKSRIICHIANKDGFVQDALWVFESNQKNDHKTIEAKSFENWFSNVLSKLEDGAVIVFDNASYNSRKSEEYPTSSSSKEDIKSWLALKKIPFEDNMLKVEFMKLINEHKIQHNEYIVDEIAKFHGKTILRIPPYHCELNPIQLIVNKIRSDFATQNILLTHPDMQNLLQEGLEKITPEIWQKSFEHVKGKVEKRMWELDNSMESFATNLSNSSDSNSTNDDINL